jgi:MFS family permease
MPFRRDRLTWFLYAVLAYYAYLQAAISPALNFLAPQLGLSDTLRGLHVTAFAAGMVGAGLVTDRLAARLGQRALLLIGGAGMALGALILAVGAYPGVTISGSFIMGFVGTFLLVIVQAALSQHHGAQRAVAFTESNVAAIVFATLAPLAVSLGAQSGLGWQAALVGGALAFALLALGSRFAKSGQRTAYSEQPSAELRTHVPEPSTEHRVPSPQSPEPSTQNAFSRTVNREPGTVNPSLPPIFWLFFAIAILVVSVEWSMLVWSGAFLERISGLATADASAALALFSGAMTVGRIAGSRLTRRFEVIPLLLLSLGLVLFGFPIFWLGPDAQIKLAGLFITGLGTGNLYPLVLSAAVGSAPAQPETASARITLGPGLAILLAPPVLGALADSAGISAALGIAGLLALLALGGVLAARFV